MGGLEAPEQINAPPQAGDPRDGWAWGIIALHPWGGAELGDPVPGAPPAPWAVSSWGENPGVQAPGPIQLQPLSRRVSLALVQGEVTQRCRPSPSARTPMCPHASRCMRMDGGSTPMRWHATGPGVAHLFCTHTRP